MILWKSSLDEYPTISICGTFLAPLIMSKYTERERKGVNPKAFPSTKTTLPREQNNSTATSIPRGTTITVDTVWLILFPVYSSFLYRSICWDRWLLNLPHTELPSRRLWKINLFVINVLPLLISTNYLLSILPAASAFCALLNFIKDKRNRYWSEFIGRTWSICLKFIFIFCSREFTIVFIIEKKKMIFF